MKHILIATAASLIGGVAVAQTSTTTTTSDWRLEQHDHRGILRCPRPIDETMHSDYVETDRRNNGRRWKHRLQVALGGRNPQSQRSAPTKATRAGTCRALTASPSASHGSTQSHEQLAGEQLVNHDSEGMPRRKRSA